jgi:hypothetical protein
LAERGLNISGLPDPATTPTVTFTANVPAAAGLVYENGDKHLTVSQMTSPSLEIPASVDVESIRQSLLSMPGLPPDVVSQLRSIQDWQHTLIIPVPQDATTSRETVDGAPALLISSQKGTAVLWQKDGVLHAVGGQATADEVMATANSLS